MLEPRTQELGQIEGAELTAEAPGEAVLLENGGGKGRYVIVCEHASNVIPPRLADLGLAKSELDRHIAWDPGALGVARQMARLLDAPLISCRVSRLVIDCNRDPAAFDAIPVQSEDTPIPGNVALDAAERSRRVADIYEPFHACVSRVIERAKERGTPRVIGMHSFTPVYRGVARPWHVGILYDRDESLSAPVLATLRKDETICVGANEPYSPSDRVYHTLDRHGQSQGLASIMIEIRNDLLQTLKQQESWARKLCFALESV